MFQAGIYDVVLTCNWKGSKGRCPDQQFSCVKTPEFLDKSYKTFISPMPFFTNEELLVR
ncbi:hypothetical protein DPMN_014985 [Dreissena polymorpha]|uniref:Uncharacterized protein n=1 Tax=Dreissena polymorpha TaxID=45954 RepID=A0A9D4S536_DREPO|nr:hypothetical protein DPMN_014985 [Dreissena polymorpha]